MLTLQQATLGVARFPPSTEKMPPEVLNYSPRLARLELGKWLAKKHTNSGPAVRLQVSHVHSSMTYAGYDGAEVKAGTDQQKGITFTSKHLVTM